MQTTMIDDASEYNRDLAVTFTVVEMITHVPINPKNPKDGIEFRRSVGLVILESRYGRLWCILES